MNALKKKITSTAPDLDKPKFVVVPEVYTFAAEREFYSSGHGAFDVRVSSFTKLYYDLLPENVSLSRAEAIALIGRIAVDNASRLRYYSGAFSRRGFAEKVYDTLEKLSSSAVEPSTLTSSNTALDGKLADLRLIYGEYERITQGKMSDANGRTEALCEWIKNNDTVIDGSEMYLVNFDVFTERQRKLLAAIEAKADSLSVYSSDRAEGYETSCLPTVYAASSKQDEYDRIADFIRLDVMSGMRFGDINVLGEDIDYNRLKRAFDARGIRFYYDKRKKLSDTEPGVLIRRILECAENGMSADNLIALAANRLALPDKEERDRFIRYVKAYSPFFVSVKNEFGKKDDPDFPVAEKARHALAKLTGYFTKKTISTANDFRERIKSLAATANLDENDAKNGRYYKLLIAAADSLVKIYGDGEYGLRRLSEAFISVTDGISVPLVPNETDTVFVGPLNSRRGFECGKLYITGFNEGVLPARTDDAGLLSDGDIYALSEEGIVIEPTNEDMNERCRDELLQLAATAKRLVFSYVADGENKKSYVLRMFEKRLGIPDSAELKPDYFYGAAYGDENDVLKAYPSKATCLKTSLTFADDPRYDTVKEAVRSDIERIMRDLSLSDVDEITGGIKVTGCSATSLQAFFDCPKKYFYRYALGVKKPKDGRVAATDVGTLLHRIIERFVKNADFTDPKAEGERIAEEELSAASEYSLKSNQRLRTYVKRDAVSLCEAAAKQLTVGDFTCVGTEIKYGSGNFENDAFLKIDGVTLGGQIDRLDAYGKYARVIDYKSGKKVELKIQDVYYGRKLQLPIYSEVARRMGYVPTGMFYFPVNDSADAGLLTGYCLSDPLIAEASLGKDNAEIFAFDARSEKEKSMVSAEDMDTMISYALAVAERAIKSMKDGYSAASPIVVAQRDSACVYCDYTAVCKGKRYERKMEKTELEELREAVKNGSDGQTT